MVQFIAGGKGEGKTKKLISMANENAKSTDGHLVFIDDDRRHIYDLHYDIRFVETGGFPLSNYREFIGFVCGVLSQDNDIKCIYVDGLTNIIKTLDDDGLLKLISKLESLSAHNDVEFVLSMNCRADDLPDQVKKLLVA
ncbi:MAG: twitching motility protein PilT [Clostridiales bacterium]|jgi:hypothetical protein|nr:twitching motility protein PilT [Clostridiales bacterium]